MMMRQKIVPFLWYDSQAEEAARFYTSLFPRSSIGAVTRYGKEGFEVHGRPPGSVMTVAFELGGYSLVALNGGPHFTFTPAISFTVTLGTEAEVDALWGALSEGGTPLMELGSYPWSEKYGWTRDRYGLSWQITLGEVGRGGDRITPSMLFVGDAYGKAEEAIGLYTSLFQASRIDALERVGPGQEPDREGTVRFARFLLDGEAFVAMESGHPHAFAFNEALSFVINCPSQDEVDHFWDGLTDGGEEGACGWLKDRFGVSWQVVPTRLNEMLRDPSPEKAARVTRAFLGMRKLELGGLEKAYAGG